MAGSGTVTAPNCLISFDALKNMFRLMGGSSCIFKKRLGAYGTNFYAALNDGRLDCFAASHIGTIMSRMGFCPGHKNHRQNNIQLK
jgi:hypothetical protein